jgi:chemosensory pili system protein ChpA (sensor histidine kinase/response regulator)
MAMPQFAKEDLITDFAAELKDYMPALAENVRRLKVDAVISPALKEIHRVVHTIKGAAALIGLADLSATAGRLEEAVEAVLAGELTLSEPVRAAVACIVSVIEAYSMRLLAGGNGSTTGPDALLLGLDESFAALSASTCNGGAPAQKTQREQPMADGMTVPSRDDTVCMVVDGDGTSTAEELIAGLDDLSEAEYSAAIDDFFASPGEPSERLGAMYLDPSIAPAADCDSDGLPIEELWEGFHQEAEEHLQEIGRCLSTLESQVTDTIPITAAQREWIRSIRRAVHTIKGAAAVIGFEEVRLWAHAFEDFLDWMFEQAAELAPDMMATLSESVDLLEKTIDHPDPAGRLLAQSLTERFQAHMGSSSSIEAALDPAAELNSPTTLAAAAAGVVPEGSGTEQPIGSPEPVPMDASSSQARTIRVNLDRLDGLANMAGEVGISFSAFDQRLKEIQGAVHEIGLLGDRLRNIARELERGYEVKAIQKLGVAYKPETPGEQVLAGNDRNAEFDLLELDRYSEFNLIIRSLNEAVVDVSAVSSRLSEFYSDLDGHLNRQRVLLSELHHKTMEIRLTPMAAISNRLHRTVRETAKQLGKKARLVISGENVELDKKVWDDLSDPLMHLMRNAVDHGLETSEERQRLGKPDVGEIKMSASYEGNHVVIRISDDGAGLDFAAIRAKALQKGMLDRDAEMPRDRLGALIFQPGFSTCSSVSEVSGRGVGLDVVQQNILRLKGSVRVEGSGDGQGARFVLRIPLTVALVQALFFDVNGRMLATPLNAISEILRVQSQDIIHEPHPKVRIKEGDFPLYYAADAWSESNRPPRSNSDSEYPLVLVLDAGVWRGAVVIDAIHGQREIVVKGLGSHLRNVKGVSGATIMGDGTVVPVLNLVELCGPKDSSKEAERRGDRAMPRGVLDILVVDDSVSVRQVVTRLLKSQGWRAETARDGLEALEKIRANPPDLIVLDVEMPRMNGYELLGHLQNQSDYRPIPVIMLTSRTAEKHRQKAREMGARGFAVKPYQDAEFIELIRRTVSESAATIGRRQPGSFDSDGLDAAGQGLTHAAMHHP